MQIPEHGTRRSVLRGNKWPSTGSGLPEFAPQIFSFLSKCSTYANYFQFISVDTTNGHRKWGSSSGRDSEHKGHHPTWRQCTASDGRNLSCRDFQIHPGPSSQQTTETTTSDQFWSSIYPIKRVELCSPLQARSYKTMEYFFPQKMWKKCKPKKQPEKKKQIKKQKTCKKNAKKKAKKKQKKQSKIQKQRHMSCLLIIIVIVYLFWKDCNYNYSNCSRTLQILNLI